MGQSSHQVLLKAVELFLGLPDLVFGQPVEGVPLVDHVVRQLLLRQVFVHPLDHVVQVDLGPARDPWVELYGNSVLNNTLHDRLDRHKLQKSQSAVWTRNNNEVWCLVTSMFRTEPSACVR